MSFTTSPIFSDAAARPWIVASVAPASAAARPAISAERATCEPTSATEAASSSVAAARVWTLCETCSEAPETPADCAVVPRGDLRHRRRGFLHRSRGAGEFGERAAHREVETGEKRLYRLLPGRPARALGFHLGFERGLLEGPGLEDLEGACHGADLVAPGGIRDCDGGVAARQGAHDAGEAKHRFRDEPRDDERDDDRKHGRGGKGEQELQACGRGIRAHRRDDADALPLQIGAERVELAAQRFELVFDRAHHHGAISGVELCRVDRLERAVAIGGKGLARTLELAATPSSAASTTSGGMWIFDQSGRS